MSVCYPSAGQGLASPPACGTQGVFHCWDPRGAKPDPGKVRKVRGKLVEKPLGLACKCIEEMGLTCFGYKGKMFQDEGSEVLEQAVQRSCGCSTPGSMFKPGLDGTLGNLIWWKTSLPMAGGWTK